MAPPDSRLHGHGAVARLRDVLAREEALRRPHAAARPEAPPAVVPTLPYQCGARAAGDEEEEAGQRLDSVLSPQLRLSAKHAPG